MSIPTLIPAHTQSLVVALPISADIDTKPTSSWIVFQSVLEQMELIGKLFNKGVKESSVCRALGFG
jgi:hypothetical protein